jgi:alpha-glucosidase
VALKAEVGKVVAMARRKGDKWYIAAINNWQVREIEVSLDFLKGGQYKMTSWSDGPNVANDAKDCLMADLKVTANSKIKIKLAAGGGYAAIIEK